MSLQANDETISGEQESQQVRNVYVAKNIYSFPMFIYLDAHVLKIHSISFIFQQRTEKSAVYSEDVFFRRKSDRAERRKAKEKTTVIYSDVKFHAKH